MGTRFAACKYLKVYIYIRSCSVILFFQFRWSWLAFTTIIRDFFMAVNLYRPVSTWRTRWNSFLKCCCVRISIRIHVHVNSYYFILVTLFPFQLCWKKCGRRPSKWWNRKSTTRNGWPFTPTWTTNSCTTPSPSWSTSSPPFTQASKVLFLKMLHFWSMFNVGSRSRIFSFPAFGQALLQCIACLLPFLDHDLIDNVAYLTASSISVLPLELHQDIVNYLCFYILPFTISAFFFLSF